MPYSVRIERLGPDGCPTGPVTWRSVATEREAIRTMREAIRQQSSAAQPSQFSIYGPDTRLLWCYTSEAGTERPLDPVVSRAPSVI